MLLICLLGAFKFLPLLAFSANKSDISHTLNVPSYDPVNNNWPLIYNRRKKKFYILKNIVILILNITFSELIDAVCPLNDLNKDPDLASKHLATPSPQPVYTMMNKKILKIKTENKF